ncbi:hypothetical protein ZOD2009_11635 [Haladaptatus paucihalophilus DX253]|uniref:UPF0146 protein SAMN05444342_2536 n=1 Tax=Haladaptatus paucihalophilus DX253 TaxID=797209 RepID=E7QU47_HALPU|nr:MULTISPECIES: UPF0146 family protein [Haladaptatus]EFW92126.1 hypothetical protein ZOD2009_11635 [Haladaptatus paucihalophilus DX253]ODR83477.1 hypothetical protein BG842_22290 [Haladaptatus sp. W1]SHK89380.1 hypothetical protein SAMN05444342_2536 [Haladaptatus paucihalophilus DX253]
MNPHIRDEIVTRLADYPRAVEVGIGNRPDVADELAATGVAVTATDIRPRTVPEGVEFRLDDVTDPVVDVYESADVIYAQNLPPELHRPALSVAEECDSVFVFTTLGGDQPSVPVRRETIPGETLFWARE